MESPNPNNLMRSSVSPAGNPRTEVLKSYSVIETNCQKLGQPWSSLSTEMIVVATTELLPAYKELLITDLEGGIQKQLELSMWYYCFKAPLQHFMRRDNAMYHHYIETGIAFYLGFIHDIGIHFDVPFVRSTQKGMFGTAPVSKRLISNAPSKGSVYYILQNSLIRVGDLLRYRKSLLEALKMYEKAVYLCPRNGHPFHQMGSTQTLLDTSSVDGIFTAIYYFARAVSVADPYIASQHNLDNLLANVKNLPAKSKCEEFISGFLLAIGSPRPVVVSAALPSFTTMLSPLVTNGSVSSSQLFRVIVVALWAWRRESSKSLLAVDSSAENVILEIIAAIINSLLIAANAHQDLFNFYALPHVKILMDWLRVNSSLVNHPIFRSKLHISSMCTFFNQLLMLENNVCGLRSRDMERIILPEEKRLLGFLPFCRTYDSLNCLIDEGDSRTIWVRIYRTLKCADCLSETRLNFIERNGPTGYFSEIPCGISSGPALQSAQSATPSTRRNVAFQSIFSQLSGPETLRPYHSPLLAASASEAEPNLPVSSQTVSTTSETSPLPEAQFFHGVKNLENACTNQGTVENCLSTSPENKIKNNSMVTTPPGFRTMMGALTPPAYPNSALVDSIQGDGDCSRFSSLFQSIWTPRNDDNAKTETDGWTA